MLTLGTSHASLEATRSDGWRAVPGGILFHFKDGVSVFISQGMADKIQQTFSEQRELDSPGSWRTKPKVRARLDADGKAEPLTRLITHTNLAHCRRGGSLNAGDILELEDESGHRIQVNVV